ncbi:MAG: fibronectin type III domain-containing protein [Prevotella sp.]|nr:fibronectin type III domain-containing protein [Prevotella sp.]
MTFPRMLEILLCILLFPNISSKAQGQTTWGNINYNGEPWVENLSRPNDISHGLQGRHLTVWASHGRYYDQEKGFWKWQRPYLFGTTEDLFTQTIVVPYLIPMLENAGAYVFTPRERDWQRHEIIVDNDAPAPYNYFEHAVGRNWETAPLRGFAFHNGPYYDGENPFEAGTARMARTTRKSKKVSTVSYQPSFPEEGRYAVYVSYQTLPKSVPDAEYRVYHKGQETVFHVNQQMGADTWVYLGTFEFDRGYNEFNRVVVSNLSSHNGVVTTDAVRFGGGMGNITRGGSTSGMARSFEGARYYAQWAGAPYDVYSSKGGENDYADDINVRSLMTNWLAGGSPYVPHKEGKRVPIELTLAIHSDAGFNLDGKSIYGPLAICTTNFNEGKLGSGLSRQASHNLADEVLSGEVRDLTNIYGYWPRRDFYDRNYSETRVPEVPSAIIETLSHQSFPDMRYGQDPLFKFTLARSIYKSLLRYVSRMHGTSYTVQPLAPDHFCVKFTGKGKVQLSWEPTDDPTERTAKATGYNVYTAIGTGGFDNGEHVRQNSMTVKLEPGVPYHFRVTATNNGGESFPTEVLTALWEPDADQTVLIVNGFHRLSAPAIIDNDSLQGFDLVTDPGIGYMTNPGWSGYQQCFERSRMGIEGPGGHGFTGNEMAGFYLAGNTFDYVRTHADAIGSAHRYNIMSCSSEALENNEINLKHVDCIDLILGLEKNDTAQVVQAYRKSPYKTFSPRMQQILSQYVGKQRGRLLVSGANLAADMGNPNEKQFLASTLKVGRALVLTPDSLMVLARNYASGVNGMGMSFEFHNLLNEKHYAATSTDVLLPLSPAYCALQYANGNSAAVAYNGSDYKSFSVGFPLECIKDRKTRNSIMRGILNFLLSK